MPKSLNNSRFLSRCLYILVFFFSLLLFAFLLCLDVAKISGNASTSFMLYKKLGPHLKLWSRGECELNKGKCTKCVYIVCLCVYLCVCLHTMHKRNTQAVKSQFYIHYNESSTTRNNNSDRNNNNNNDKDNNKNNNLRLKASRSSFLWLSLAHLIESAFTHTNTSRHTHRPSHIDNHPHPPTHTHS